jgi:hypothetical protein
MCNSRAVRLVTVKTRNLKKPSQTLLFLPSSGYCQISGTKQVNERTTGIFQYGKVLWNSGEVLGQ